MASRHLTYDCVIVGAGVIGLTTAYELRRLMGSEGRMAILDQGQPGREASWAGAGMIPPAEPQATSQALTELARFSAKRWPSISQELLSLTGISNGYTCCGSINLCASWKEAQEEISHWHHQGVEAQLLTQPADDSFKTPVQFEHSSAYLLPAAAQVRNPWHLNALKAAVSSRDDIHSGTPVTGAVIQNERLIALTTPQGTFHADRFLFSAGAWTANLLSQCGLTLPEVDIIPMRGQIVLLQRNSLAPWRIVEQGKRYIVPRPDGRVLIGSTEEPVGFDKRTTAGGIQSLLDFALTAIPELQSARLEQTWAGLRPWSRRGVPFMGACPQLNNLFLAAGHFRAGLTLSPGSGLNMAELMLERPTTLPRTLLDQLAPVS